MSDDLQADARAELAALREQVGVARCRAGAHVGGAGCQVHPEVDLPLSHGPCDLCEATAPAPVDRGLHAQPFEVWAARR